MLVLIIFFTSCQKIKPTWMIYNLDELWEVKSLAVIAGEYDSAVSHCILSMQKDLIRNLESSNRYHVLQYRDVFMAMESPQINVSVNSEHLDHAMAGLLKERLKVDGVIILSMEFCNSSQGNQVSVALFSTGNGERIGTFNACTHRHRISTSRSLLAKGVTTSLELTTALLRDNPTNYSSYTRYECLR